jgi:hypothetical protein
LGTVVSGVVHVPQAGKCPQYTSGYHGLNRIGKSGFELTAVNLREVVADDPRHWREQLKGTGLLERETLFAPTLFEGAEAQVGKTLVPMKE